MFHPRKVFNTSVDNPVKIRDGEQGNSTSTNKLVRFAQFWGIHLSANSKLSVPFRRTIEMNFDDCSWIADLVVLPESLPAIGDDLD